MNYDPWEAPLRAAKPTNDEITPLSPEASSRILSAALRANRRGRRIPFWHAAPFRVFVASAATAAFAYCLMPRIDLGEVPVAESTVAAPVASAAKRGGAEVLGVSQRDPQSAKSLPKPSTLPTLPSVLPKPVAPSVMLAREGVASPPRPQSWGSRKWRVSSAGRAQRVGARSGSPRIGGGGGILPQQETSRDPNADEGNMYVSVTGDSVLPPESDTEDGLTVTVHRDVPDTVSGSAEAAALHAIPVPSATPDPADAQAIPVWTHVRVETGEEPVLTLTAIN